MVNGARGCSGSLQAGLEETTDSALFVRTSADGMADFSGSASSRHSCARRSSMPGRGNDRPRGRGADRAFGIRTLTAPLIRELVDARLLEHGLEGARRLHTRLGMPLYDVEQLLLARTRRTRTSRTARGDELTLAENIKKEYALLRSSPRVADAHMRGTCTCTTSASSTAPTARASRWSTSRNSG